MPFITVLSSRPLWLSTSGRLAILSFGFSAHLIAAIRVKALSRHDECRSSAYGGRWRHFRTSFESDDAYFTAAPTARAMRRRRNLPL